jgi:hypothetical protein
VSTRAIALIAPSRLGAALSRWRRVAPVARSAVALTPEPLGWSLSGSRSDLTLAVCQIRAPLVPTRGTADRLAVMLPLPMRAESVPRPAPLEAIRADLAGERLALNPWRATSPLQAMYRGIPQNLEGIPRDWSAQNRQIWLYRRAHGCLRKFQKRWLTGW